VLTIAYARFFFFMMIGCFILTVFFYTKAANGCPSDELSNFHSKYGEDLQKRVLDRFVFVGINANDWLRKQPNFKRRLIAVSDKFSLCPIKSNKGASQTIF